PSSPGSVRAAAPTATSNGGGAAAPATDAAASAVSASSGGSERRPGRWSAIAVDPSAFTWDNYARKYFRQAATPLSPRGAETREREGTVRGRNKTASSATAAAAPPPAVPLSPRTEAAA